MGYLLRYTHLHCQGAFGYRTPGSAWLQNARERLVTERQGAGGYASFGLGRSTEASFAMKCDAILIK